MDEKNKLIKALQDQVLTLKEKIKDLNSKKTNDKEEEEMEEDNETQASSKKAPEEEKTRGNMIKAVTRQSAKGPQK
jgi:hypothetical protein